MRNFLLITLSMIANAAHGQGLFVESNFSDTQFTVRAQALDVVSADMPEHMQNALITNLKVLEVYHGDLKEGDTLELIIESDALNSLYRQGRMQGEFLTSFCLSDTGIYYTNIIFPASEDNLAAVEHYREHGTTNWDRHDCAYTNSKVQNPDDLDYEKPVPEYTDSQSSLRWRKDNEFMSAFKLTLKNKQISNWVSNFEGIGQSQSELNIGGDFGLVNDSNTFFIGNPSDELKSALLSLHDENYSQYSIEKRLYDTNYFNNIIAAQKQVRKARSKSPSLGDKLVEIYIKQ